MATTRIMPLHTGKGRSVARALKDTVDYMENPYKTDFGEWVSSYECDVRTADNGTPWSRQYARLHILSSKVSQAGIGFCNVFRLG